MSGSAAIGTDKFGMERLRGFVQKLGKGIIAHGYNLVSGYGLGIGSDLLVGALEGAYLSSFSIRERLILRPFPRSVEEARKVQVYREWRKAMVSMAGFPVFLAGNKTDPGDRTKVIPGHGVMEEFELGTTVPIHSYPIPIGATGYVAQDIWRIVMADQRRFFGAASVDSELRELNDPMNTDEAQLEAIFALITKVRSGNI